MPNNHSERKKEIEEKYDYVIWGKEYKATHLIGSIADIWLTGGQYTLETIKKDALELGMDLLKWIVENDLSKSMKFYVHNITISHWETPIVLGQKLGKILLPNSFRVYVAVNVNKRFQNRKVFIINKKYRKALNLQQCKDHYGVPNISNPCNHPDQIWKIINLKDKNVKIRNIHHYRDLNLQPQENKNGGIVSVYHPFDHPDQVWKLIETISPNIFYIKHQLHNKYLSIENGKVSIWHLNHSTDLMWEIKIID